MDQVILVDIKKMLGIEESVSEYDVDIQSSINSAFFVLHQLGIGSNGLIQIGPSTTWDEISTSSPKEVVRDYVYYKVKLVFDTPGSSFVADAIKDRISELEFRLNICSDNGGGIING